MMPVRKVFGQHFRIKKPRFFHVQKLFYRKAHLPRGHHCRAVCGADLCVRPRRLRRVSDPPPGEALTLLPLFFPEAIPALYVGCLLANLASPFLLYDLTIGPLATLAAAVCTYLIGVALRKYTGKGAAALKVGLGGIFPILFNAFVIPAVIVFLCSEGADATTAVYWTTFASFLLTETVWVIGLGTPLYAFVSGMRKKGVSAFTDSKKKTAHTPAVGNAGVARRTGAAPFTAKQTITKPRPDRRTRSFYNIASSCGRRDMTAFTRTPAGSGAPRRLNHTLSMPAAAAPAMSDESESPIIRHLSAVVPSARSICAKKAGSGLTTPISSETNTRSNSGASSESLPACIAASPLVAMHRRYLFRSAVSVSTAPSTGCAGRGERLRKDLLRLRTPRAEPVLCIGKAHDVADMGMVQRMIAGAQLGQMDVVQPELPPIPGGKRPTRLHHVRIGVHTRCRERRAEGAPLVRVKVDHGMVGVKNKIVILHRNFLCKTVGARKNCPRIPAGAPHQSCFFRLLSFTSSYFSKYARFHSAGEGASSLPLQKARYSSSSSGVKSPSHTSLS